MNCPTCTTPTTPSPRTRGTIDHFCPTCGHFYPDEYTTSGEKFNEAHYFAQHYFNMSSFGTTARIANILLEWERIAGGRWPANKTTIPPSMETEQETAEREERGRQWAKMRDEEETANRERLTAVYDQPKDKQLGLFDN